MQTAWRLASYESTTDVKELIPELFYLPEFLLNLEGILKIDVHGKLNISIFICKTILCLWVLYGQKYGFNYFAGFDFGVRQTGERVWNVSLPPWSRQNPRLFILVHRQALESNYVTSDLGSWIDLVFGFRQQGKSAVDAVNVFHPAVS